MDDLSEYFIKLGHKLIKIGERIKIEEQDKIKANRNRKLFTIAKKALKFIDENFPELNKAKSGQMTSISTKVDNFNLFGDFSTKNREEMTIELNNFKVEMI